MIHLVNCLWFYHVMSLWSCHSQCYVVPGRFPTQSSCCYCPRPVCQLKMQTGRSSHTVFYFKRCLNSNPTKSKLTWSVLSKISMYRYFSVLKIKNNTIWLLCRIDISYSSDRVFSLDRILANIQSSCTGISHCTYQSASQLFQSLHAEPYDTVSKPNRVSQWGVSCN